MIKKKTQEANNRKREREREREGVTGRVFRLRPTLMKTAASVERKKPQPIARKPVEQQENPNKNPQKL